MARTSKTWAGRHTAGQPNAENTASTANHHHASSSTAPAASSSSAATAASTAAAKSSKAPKSVLDKIIFAIRQQPGSKSSKGVSRLAITKYLKAELQYDNANAIKTALKKGVEKGHLDQTGQSFRVKGDPIAADEEGPQLEITDVTIGGGEGNDASTTGISEMTTDIGDSITVKYVGKLDDGQKFDAAPSFTFVLGAGEVVKGWDQGLLGMKIGGKRKLIVPPKLGYGKRGSPPDIPGNATLHFVVTLKAIDRPNSS